MKHAKQKPKKTNGKSAPNAVVKNGQQYEVSIRKTFPYPVQDAYERAATWLERDDRLRMHRDDAHRKLMCDWLTDDSKIALNFLQKGKTKTEMVIEHDHLDSESDADIMRNFWEERVPQIMESF